MVGAGIKQALATHKNSFPSEASVGSLVFGLLVAAAVRLGVLLGVDLRPPFGPDAPGAAISALTGPFYHPYPLHPLLISVFLPVCGGEPSRAALVLSVVSGLVMVAAAWRMGSVLLGEYGGRAAGATVATAPLAVAPALLGGGDAPALAIAFWGVALVWTGASRLGTAPRRMEEAQGGRSRSRVRIGATEILTGGALVGLSAAVKPVALPCMGLVLVGIPIGRRQALPWLGVSLVCGVLLALPFLGPLLHPQQGMGLLGSWWHPAPPKRLSEWGMLLFRGADILWQQEHAGPWWMFLPIFLLALFGGLVRGRRRWERFIILILSSFSMLLVAGILGDRLRPRYLTGAAIGWLVLAGIATVPWRFRVGGVPFSMPPQDKERHGSLSATFVVRLAFFDTLPLSLLMTLFVVSTFRYWETLGLLRAQEEGAGAPRGWLSGWGESRRPVEDYADSSICGAIELERLGSELAQSLPQGARVMVIQLRDGRAWNLWAPILKKRRDLELIEVDARCCPPDPATCASRIPAALAETGGVLVVPLSPPGRCETGAVPPDMEALRLAMESIVINRGTWFGTLEIPRFGSAFEVGRHACDILGGRRPGPPVEY